MQKILTQISVNSNEHDADDSDWTLLRVAETCGTSPARPTSPWKGCYPAQANSKKPDSQPRQPTEKPLTSLENGPSNDPDTDLHNNKKPDTVPFIGLFFYQRSGSNLRAGPKMWTLEVCRQYASAITELFTRSSAHPLPSLIPLHTIGRQRSHQVRLGCFHSNQVDSGCRVDSGEKWQAVSRAIHESP
jgi:hypothetical protein